MRAGCRALPDPPPGAVFDNVHVRMPEDLRRQRDEFAEFVAEVAS